MSNWFFHYEFTDLSGRWWILLCIGTLAILFAAITVWLYMPLLLGVLLATLTSKLFDYLSQQLPIVRQLQRFASLCLPCKELIDDLILEFIELVEHLHEVVNYPMHFLLKVNLRCFGQRRGAASHLQSICYNGRAGVIKTKLSSPQ